MPKYKNTNGYNYFDGALTYDGEYFSWGYGHDPLFDVLLMGDLSDNFDNEIVLNRLKDAPDDKNKKELLSLLEDIKNIKIDTDEYNILKEEILNCYVDNYIEVSGGVSKTVPDEKAYWESQKDYQIIDAFFNFTSKNMNSKAKEVILNFVNNFAEEHDISAENIDITWNNYKWVTERRKYSYKNDPTATYKDNYDGAKNLKNYNVKYSEKP